MVYPKEHYVKPEKTRYIIFVNKHISTDSWIQVNFGLLEVAAIQIQTAMGKILIINTYNQILHSSTINQILQVMRARA